MKRIICWDLWGTIIQSLYTGQTYEDYLTQYDERHIIQGIVRGILMTNAAQGLVRLGQTMGVPYLPLAQLLHQKLCPGRKTTLDEHQVAELWRLENQLVQWIEGARETISVLGQKRPQDIHVLVSNTTEIGWEDTNLQLYYNSRVRVPVVFGPSNLVLSCNFPVAKPDPHIWQKVKFLYRGDEYWMIGNDPLIDIAVPAAMGWKTILVNHLDGVAITEVPKIMKEAE